MGAPQNTLHVMPTRTDAASVVEISYRKSAESPAHRGANMDLAGVPAAGKRSGRLQPGGFSPDPVRGAASLLTALGAVGEARRSMISAHPVAASGGGLLRSVAG